MSNGNGTERLRFLRALRLKGRLPAPDLGTATGISVSQIEQLVSEFFSKRLIEEARGQLKLTPAGREFLATELATERRGLDASTVTGLYAAFDEHNNALKSLMTRWQLKGDGTPNDHTDADYDNAVVNDLAKLDAGFQPLLKRIVETAPRLEHYPPRLTTALDRILNGDHAWFAKPLVDSYHTVWFELHEDLIGIAGLSRTEEAAAGRAE